MTQGLLRLPLPEQRGGPIRLPPAVWQAAAPAWSAPDPRARPRPGPDRRRPAPAPHPAAGACPAPPAAAAGLGARPAHLPRRQRTVLVRGGEHDARLEPALRLHTEPHVLAGPPPRVSTTRSTIATAAAPSPAAAQPQRGRRNAGLRTCSGRGARSECSSSCALNCMISVMPDWHWAQPGKCSRKASASIEGSSPSMKSWRWSQGFAISCSSGGEAPAACAASSARHGAAWPPCPWGRPAPRRSPGSAGPGRTSPRWCGSSGSGTPPPR